MINSIRTAYKYKYIYISTIQLRVSCPHVMRFLFGAFLAASTAVAIRLPDSIVTWGKEDPQLLLPSKEQAAQVARTLVYRESLMNVNTIDQKDNVPVSSMEYYADCDDDGDPYWLIVDIGSTYQNLKIHPSYSFTIRSGDHPPNEEVNTDYPGAIKSSPAGSPRLNLRGELMNVTFQDPLELLRIERCFVLRHPDAKWWLPNNAISPHKSHWVKIKVHDIYMIGGFGNMAYIGPIDEETYHTAIKLN